MDIQQFTNSEFAVDVIPTGNSFKVLAPGVARALGFAESRDLLRSIPENEKGSELAPTPGGEQRVGYLTEAGFYRAIGQRQAARIKNSAVRSQVERFQTWVWGDLIPSIRKHGGYLTPAKIEEALTDPDTIIRLATDLKKEREQRAALEAQAKADRPKVLFADAVSTSHTTILVGELAKILRGNGINVGGTRLFAWLRANGFLINRKGSDWNSPTQKSLDLGIMRIKENTIVHSDGHTSITKTPKVTGKGQEYFVARFLDGRFQIDKAA